MDAAVRTRGLRKDYGTLAAVDGLDLEVQRGAIFGFLGPNGAGKTTTLRMLLGLIAPTGGEAHVLGHDIVRQRAQIARKVGAIVETPAFYPFLSGRQNLEVLARTSGLRPGQAQLSALLDRVGLLDRGDDAVKGYSLGMKQRLGIASALLTEPEIVFLDEPTNGLDPQGALAVRSLIAALAAEGRTVFLSSHLLHEVETTCTDVAIVRAGKVVLAGPVRTLLQGGEILFRVRPLERAAELLGQTHAVIAEPDRLRVRAREDEVPALVRRLASAGVDVLEVRPDAPALEELFFRTLGAAAPESQAVAA